MKPNLKIAKMTPGIFRSLIPRLITRKWSYLPGMVLVRMARKVRKRNYRENRGIEQVVISNFAGGLKMRIDRNSYMGGSIYWTGYHHINEFLYLKKSLKEDMTFIDVGANQGEFTLFAASLLKKGKVMAFEPVSANFNSLQENIRLNGFTNVVTYKFGLFNEDSTLPVYTSLDESAHSGRHEGLSTLFKGDYRSVMEESIELQVFDDRYFDDLERFDFLKIDIEGAELYALKGMKRSLEKFRPAILIEISSETFEQAGYSVDELLEFLYELGYKAFSIFRGRLIEKKEISQEWGNYVFYNG